MNGFWPYFPPSPIPPEREFKISPVIGKNAQSGKTTQFLTARFKSPHGEIFDTVEESDGKISPKFNTRGIWRK
jgi:hypothetical protein